MTNKQQGKQFNRKEILVNIRSQWYMGGSWLHSNSQIDPVTPNGPLSVFLHSPVGKLWHMLITLLKSAVVSCDYYSGVYVLTNKLWELFMN